MPDDQEQDVFARAGITDADFADEPEIGSMEAPAEDEAEAPPADATDDRPRDEHGRFAPKEKPAEGAEAGVAPAGTQEPEAAPPVAPAPAVNLNLGAAERAAWAAVPAELRGAVERRVSEIEKGISEYRAKYEPIRQYAEMAEQNGTTLAAAMQNYIGIEDTLRQNPLQGLDRICQNLGLSLRDVAAHVMGQPAPERDAEVTGLRQQMQAMQADLTRYQAAEQRQQEEARTAALDTVSKFSAEAPRFGELQHYISWALQTGAVPRTGDAAADLRSAYQFAERLVPATASAAPAAPQEPRTPPANLSVDGGPGSNPGYTPPKDRLQNIGDRLAQYGL